MTAASSCFRSSIFGLATLLVIPGVGAVTIEGLVVDTNGQPLPFVQVVFDRDEAAPGASVVTVFTSADGMFRFPGDYTDAGDLAPRLSARALGYEQHKRTSVMENDAQLQLSFILAPRANQIAVAPASAWLQRIPDPLQRSQLLMDCIDCHQVPGPEVRAYAGQLADLPVVDHAAVRLQGWQGIVKYMNYLSAWEFGRASRSQGEVLSPDAVYGVDNESAVAALLANTFTDGLEHIEGYEWGAPSIATPTTVIWEYEVPAPNAVREALMTRDHKELWLADVAANRMVVVDLASGVQRSEEIPSEQQMSPHSMHPAADGSLWVTPLFNSIIGNIDPATGTWRTWQLRTADGKSPGIHDLSFGYEHTLLTDPRGRIWFSDIGNNAVGYFDPGEGTTQIWSAPASPGRPGRTSMYGLSMTKDRNEVWYSQLGNGTFGGYDIGKNEYIGPFQLPDRNAGPRRITINDEDVLYIALYGSGQIAEFNTKTREMIGVYDLPDTASAPYSATWDPVRRVVWIPTSNGDVIYRFDPVTKSFGVLPLPRAQTFLRMVDVDPRTGVLVTSYGNIVDIVQGPRMALVIDPGDDAYPEQFTTANVMSRSPAKAPVIASTRLSGFIGSDTENLDGAALISAARCNACHDDVDPSLGPPWQAVATRHAANRAVMEDVLAQKIVDGGGGAWGTLPMVPNQWVETDEARRMAAWILDQSAQ